MLVWGRVCLQSNLQSLPAVSKDAFAYDVSALPAQAGFSLEVPLEGQAPTADWGRCAVGLHFSMHVTDTLTPHVRQVAASGSPRPFASQRVGSTPASLSVSAATRGRMNSTMLL